MTDITTAAVKEMILVVGRIVLVTIPCPGELKNSLSRDSIFREGSTTSG
jgi:hypothetical protein